MREFRLFKGLREYNKYMSKSTKIIVGIMAVILIIVVGFVLLKKRGGTQGSLFSPNNPSQNASGLEHIIRPLMNGGAPGDGGGG